jgi:uncharacterized membrane protein HdeD (DUF308 family)
MKSGQLMQLFSEFVMFVLGSLLLFLAVTNRFTLPASVTLWVALGAVLVVWGVRVWLRRVKMERKAARALQGVRAWSLALSGTVLILMVWMPFSNAPVLLSTVGAILALRGLLGAVLATRLAMR